ncbi:hypothetical protein [Rhodococcus sp. UNC363MFTsu5.1]|uniref:hypothetical protein n=1 Tax=Rhodococcus sp. UNC363MFTsu5.1 TaxID=1449069 RepID=UPI0012DD1850|nr:hypothetical protein [Rhodococcus sp. UNC363MFTsu5.1]
MQARVWEAGSTRMRRTVGLAATVGMTAAVVAGVTGGASVAAADVVVGCTQAGIIVNCAFKVDGEHVLPIPAGVTSVKVTAFGEAGQNGVGTGGLGGVVTADVPVTGGTNLYVLVGEGAGNGGGFSGVATESLKQDREKGLKSRTLVAPGGGAGSLGVPGANAGESGSGAAGGKAGTANAGGAGGSGSPSGASGVLGDGGAGVNGGGDGGSGYYGGGGGAAFGAGGGGSYLVPKDGTKRLAAAGDKAKVLIQFNSLNPIIPIPGLPDLSQLSSSFGS